MQTEHWQKVKELFNAALERDPHEREAFLDDACSNDPALRSDVASLVSSYEKTGEFLDAPALAGSAADFLVQHDSSVEAPKMLGSYQVLKTLGRGGMGEVYLAEDTRLGRKVALKLLPTSFSSDSERVARFAREARAASALNHPNILTIYEVGSADGRQFIASEYVEGETLRQRQIRSKLKLDEVLDVSVQVASALAAAHQANIVHRDIKPENIMLRPDGYAKVVDFGLAKQTGKSRTSTEASTLLQADTDTGVVMGTTSYMSPEQARGQELDGRTDIWSLGVVMYQLLSASMPFKGDTASDLIVSILEREPTPLRTLANVPSELDWIVRKALRKDREERYQTARELLSDLRGVKQQLDFEAQKGHIAPETSTQETESPGIGTDTDQSRVQTDQVGQTLTVAQAPTAAHVPVWRTVAVVAGLALLATAIIFIGYKLWANKATAPFARMNITRLTNSGKVIDSILSPDGKYLVYVLSDAGKQSLWIKQVTVANDKVIVPPATVGYFGITFSRDGNDVYYVLKQQLDRGTLYKVPALGGTAVKVLEAIDSPITHSPDGKQFAFLRGNFPNQGESVLIVCDGNGSNQRVLATKKAPQGFVPIFFTGPSWSPDGKLIAATIGGLGTPFHVGTYAVADGQETLLPNASGWRFVGRTEWLPDMTGLLMIAGESSGTSQIWFVPYPSGEPRKITNDLNSYRAISLTADASKFSTVQTAGLVNIWIAPKGEAAQAIQLPTGNVGFYSGGTSVTWTPDGSLVFVSDESGVFDIWSMNASGENRKQLTANAGMNVNPDVSSDGRYIVFVSSRTGKRNIWRMDIDGNNPKQLTHAGSDFFPVISPDNKWVIFTTQEGGKTTLWKVGIDGGAPVQIVNRPATSPSISPDGKYISYLFPESPDPLAPSNRIAIIPFDGGEPLMVLQFPVGGTVLPTAHWSLDGKSILYTVNTNNVTNIWSHPVDGKGQPKQITDFKESLMTGFSYSRDGKNLAASRGNLVRDAVLITDLK